MSSKRSSGSQVFSSVSRDITSSKSLSDVFWEARSGLEIESKEIWNKFRYRYKQFQHLHHQGKHLIVYFELFVKVTCKRKVLFVRPNYLLRWQWQNNRWNSAYKCQGFTYFVTIFRTLRRTISLTIFTWRARESRTNAENIQRICSSTTAQDDALLNALYFFSGTKCVCCPSVWPEDIWRIRLSCLKGPCLKRSSLSPNTRAEENREVMKILPL